MDQDKKNLSSILENFLEEHLECGIIIGFTIDGHRVEIHKTSSPIHSYAIESLLKDSIKEYELPQSVKILEET